MKLIRNDIFEMKIERLSICPSVYICLSFIKQLNDVMNDNFFLKKYASEISYEDSEGTKIFF